MSPLLPAFSSGFLAHIGPRHPAVLLFAVVYAQTQLADEQTEGEGVAAATADISTPSLVVSALENVGLVHERPSQLLSEKGTTDPKKYVDYLCKQTRQTLRSSSSPDPRRFLWLVRDAAVFNWQARELKELDLDWNWLDTIIAEIRDVFPTEATFLQRRWTRPEEPLYTPISAISTEENLGKRRLVATFEINLLTMSEDEAWERAEEEENRLRREEQREEGEILNSDSDSDCDSSDDDDDDEPGPSRPPNRPNSDTEPDPFISLNDENRPFTLPLASTPPPDERQATSSSKRAAKPASKPPPKRRRVGAPSGTLTKTSGRSLTVRPTGPRVPAGTVPNLGSSVVAPAPTLSDITKVKLCGACFSRKHGSAYKTIGSRERFEACCVVVERTISDSQHPESLKENLRIQYHRVRKIRHVVGFTYRTYTYVYAAVRLNEVNKVTNDQITTMMASLNMLSRGDITDTRLDGIKREIVKARNTTGDLLLNELDLYKIVQSECSFPQLCVALRTLVKRHEPGLTYDEERGTVTFRRR